MSGAGAREDWQLHERQSELLCTYCRASFAEAPAQVCVCGARLHAECRAELGRCTTLGCGGGLSEAPGEVEVLGQRERPVPGYPPQRSRTRGGSAWLLLALASLCPALTTAVVVLSETPRLTSVSAQIAALTFVMGLGLCGWMLRRGLRQLRADRAQWRALDLAPPPWSVPVFPWEGGRSWARDRPLPRVAAALLLWAALATCVLAPAVAGNPSDDVELAAASLTLFWGLALAALGLARWWGRSEVHFDPLRLGERALLEVSLPRHLISPQLCCTLRCLVEREAANPLEPQRTIRSVVQRWSQVFELPRPPSGPLRLELDLPAELPPTSLDPYRSLTTSLPCEVVRWELEIAQAGREGWGELVPLPVFPGGDAPRT